MTDYRETIGKSKKENQTGILGGVADGVKDAWDDGTDAVGDAVDTGGGNVGDAVDDTVDTIGDIGSDPSGTIDDVGSSVDDVASGFVDTAQDPSDAFGDVASGIEDAAEPFTGSDTFDEISETANSLGDTFGGIDPIEDVGDAVGDIAGGDLGGIGDAIDDSIDSVGSLDDFASNTLDDIGGGLGGIGDDITGGLGGIADGIGDFGGDIKGGLGGIGDSIGDIGGDLVDDTLGAGGGLVDFTEDALGGTLDGAVDLGGDAKNLVTGGGEGGKQWGEPTEVEQRGRCVIQKQDASDGSSRFLTVTKNQDGETVALNSDGEKVVISSVDSASNLPWHNSLSDAQSACDVADMPTAWGEVEQHEQHSGGIVLVQTSPEGEERYFAVVSDGEGGTAAVATDGSTIQITDDMTFDDAPQYPDAESARAALDKHGGVSRQWGEMQEVTTTGQCIIAGQESSDGNQRFFTFTYSNDGEMVAMANDGTATVVSSVENAQDLPHYPTAEDATAACPSSEGQPESGGDQTTTDDSTSSDGPQSDNNQVGQDEISSDDGQEAPSIGEVGSGWSSNTGTMDGIMSQTIMGVPLPVAALGGVGVGGIVIKSVLGGDDPIPNRNNTRNNTSKNKTRSSTKENVKRRGGNGKGKGGS